MIRKILRKYFHLPVLYKNEIALSFRDGIIPTIYLPKMESYNDEYLFVLGLAIILKGKTKEHEGIIESIRLFAEKIFRESGPPR